jgi:hypothetical protein
MAKKDAGVPQEPRGRDFHLYDGERSFPEAVEHEPYGAVKRHATWSSLKQKQLGRKMFTIEEVESIVRAAVEEAMGEKQAYAAMEGIVVGGK